MYGYDQYISIGVQSVYADSKSNDATPDGKHCIKSTASKQKALEVCMWTTGHVIVCTARW